MDRRFIFPDFTHSLEAWETRDSALLRFEVQGGKSRLCRSHSLQRKSGENAACCRLGDACTWLLKKATLHQSASPFAVRPAGQERPGRGWSGVQSLAWASIPGTASRTVRRQRLRFRRGFDFSRILLRGAGGAHEGSEVQPTCSDAADGARGRPSLTRLARGHEHRRALGLQPVKYEAGAAEPQRRRQHILVHSAGPLGHLGTRAAALQDAWLLLLWPPNADARCHVGHTGSLRMKASSLLGAGDLNGA